MIERFARLGYASIGAVYVIAGALATAAALGYGGSTGGHHGAFTLIRRQPFGRTLLAVIVLGLAGYALWRIISGFADSDGRGSDAKGLAIRFASVFRGLVHGLLTLEVIRVILHRDHGDGTDVAAKHWTARLVDEPFGQTLIVAAGLGIIAYGAYQFYKAFESKLGKRLHIEQIDAAVRRKFVAISRFGLAARGAVFFLIGGSLVVAGVRHNPSAAHGTTGALRLIAEPLDGALLVVVGIGLVAYGVYALANARYRSIRT